MAFIYYKESTKNFPPLGHPLIPPLFIEAGKMPCSSQDKAKPCIILVNLAGIYFLRPEKLKKTYKISKFISSFLITEIVYDEKKRTILTKHDNAYIQCPHMDEAIVQLVSSRKFLLQKVYDKSPVKFTDFPTQPIINSNMQVNASLLALQYICYCIQHDVVPDDIGITPIFQKFDPQHHSIMYFDEFCSAPSYLNCLCGPIHFLDSITTLHFSNFAPYSACRIIHKIMRHQFRIRTFIIDGYQHLVPEQLRMEKLTPKGLISIVIQNCRLPEETMIKLFNELGEYQGEVQRFSLRNIELTDKSWKILLNIITTCRAFRTLEIFELDKIEASQFYEDQLHDDILTINKHCRFIQRFSISLWAQPQLLTCIEPFFVNSFLYELVLQGQNITQPFSNSLKLPRPLHYLDFSGCNFTNISLKSLFAFLARTPDHNPITLNLADIMLPSAQWHQFYQELSTVKQVNYIGELDWSGNGMDPLFIRDIVSFFFTTNPIRFLTIDRVFGSNKIEDFCTFFNAIPHGKLKGLSIGGSSEQNFSGNFAQLFKGISPVCPLKILHLVGQKMQPADIQPLMAYLGENSSSLWELFIDDTNFSSAHSLCEFYQSIFDLGIPIVGRPNIDLKRLFGSKTFGDINNLDDLKKFREQIAQLPPETSRSARAYYISRIQSQKGFDLNQYITFVQKYPACFFNPDDIDPFQLQFKSQKALLPSLLFLMRGKRDIRSLSELHANCLVEPNKLPLYSLPPKFNNGTTADSGFNDYDNQNNYQAMNQLSSFTNQSMPYSDQPNITNQQQTINNNQEQQVQQNPETQPQNLQPTNNYDQQFTSDPNFLNQGYDQQFIPDPNFLNQAYDSQFTPDPYFLQNQQNSQFQPQPLEPLEPLEPQQEQQQQEQQPPQLEQLQPQLEPVEPPPQLEPLQPLSSDNQQLSEKSTINNLLDDQFMPSSDFIHQDQFQFDPQFLSSQDGINNNQFASYDPNQEFSPQFIPDPNIDMMLNPQNKDLNVPPLHDSNDGQNQDLFIPPPPSFTPTPLNEIEPAPQLPELEPLQPPSNDFIPQPPFVSTPEQTPPQDQPDNQQQSNLFIPPPENSLQSNIFIPPPPEPIQPQIEQPQETIPPPFQEDQTQQQLQPSIIPPLENTLQSNIFIPPLPEQIQPQIDQPQNTIPPPQEQQSFILPPLQSDQTQQQQQQQSFIPPPLQSEQTQPQLQPSFIPPPLNPLHHSQSSAIPPPLQPTLLHPQAPTGFIPPPLNSGLGSHTLRSSLTPLPDKPPDLTTQIPPPNQPETQLPSIPSSPITVETQIPQMPSIPPPPPIKETPQMPSIPPPPTTVETQIPQMPSIPPPPPISEPQVPQMPSIPPPPPISEPQVPQMPSIPPPPTTVEPQVPQMPSIPPPPITKTPQMPSIPPPTQNQDQLEKEQKEKELLEQQQRERELNEQKEREIREQQQKAEEEKQADKPSVSKNRGWSYAPNEPRRGPPVLIQKLTLTSKKSSKKNRFPSAAGLIDLPHLPNYSRQPITAAKREVTIPQSGKVSILEPTELAIPQPLEELKSFEDVDVPDLITIKSVSTSEKKREYKVFDHSFEDSVNNFYEAKNGQPFQLLKPTPESNIVTHEMAHPLQKRKILDFPHVKILGVPSEW